MSLLQINPVFLADEEIITQAVKLNSQSFLYAHDSIKQNTKLLLQLVKVNYNVFVFFQNQLKNSKDFCEQCLLQNVFVFRVFDFFQRENLQDLAYKINPFIYKIVKQSNFSFSKNNLDIV